MSGAGTTVPAISTIKKRSDFLAARSGVRYHGHAFVLQVVRRSPDSTEPIRFGLTVTKRIGNAVVRNRIKRRLRAAIAALAPEMAGEAAGLDIVIIARAEALDFPFEELVDDLRKGVREGAARLVAKGRVKGQ
ncbi:ribonuclease P protein component [Pseudahrensia aquimaris]|uniref:Ribonuclease P protein component n=1 Tax=Pseudahrensia aquimaris TaxID=744461 RepID=A0ABW3FHD9_9HYPH